MLSSCRFFSLYFSSAVNKPALASAGTNLMLSFSKKKEREETHNSKNRGWRCSDTITKYAIQRHSKAAAQNLSEKNVLLFLQARMFGHFNQTPPSGKTGN